MWVSAQQPSALRFSATTGERPSHVGPVRHARSSDRERCASAQVEQDPSLPSRRSSGCSSTTRASRSGAPRSFAIRTRGVPCRSSAMSRPQPDLDTQPGLTAEAAAQLLLSRAGCRRHAAAPRRSRPCCRWQSGEPRLAYTSVVASRESRVSPLHRRQYRRRAAALLVHADTVGGRHRPGLVGDTKKMSVTAARRSIRRRRSTCGRRC